MSKFKITNYIKNLYWGFGVLGMIDDLVERAVRHRKFSAVPATLEASNPLSVAQMLSAIEDGVLGESQLEKLRREWKLAGGKVPVIGITGTGGAGKSSVLKLMTLLERPSRGTVTVNGRQTASCTMQAAEGMVVESETEELNAERRALTQMLVVFESTRLKLNALTMVSVEPLKRANSV